MLETIGPDLNKQDESACDRRTFLKLAGFTFAGAVLAGCQQSKVDKAIPFLVKPEEVTPGLSTWYATTCAGCSAGCGVMAKNRDGRPTKLEGNPNHPLSKGGLCAIGQASVLSLYDSLRLDGPMAHGMQTSWEEIDKEIRSQLDATRKSNGAIRILTGTITSPTTREMIRRFLAGFRNGKHVVYDALSLSSILDAHQQTHAARVLPHYQFDRAEVIVSFDADFLGTWISPVEFTVSYRAGRSLRGPSSRFSFHAQIESRLSLTGSNADKRIIRAPSQIRSMIHLLASQLEQRQSGRVVPASATDQDQTVVGLAERLWNARGKSLVVCGVNDLKTQLLVNRINNFLANYGSTVDIERPSYQRQGSDGDLWRLLEELKSGSVQALLIQGANPVYDLPERNLAEQLKKVPLVVSFSERIDETAAVARFVCPEPHALEGWNDTEAVAGVVAVVQPVIEPFGNTRALAESLSAWMGKPQPAYELIRQEWKRTVFRRQTAVKDFQSFWDKAVCDGWIQVSPPKQKRPSFNNSAFHSIEPVVSPLQSEGRLELLLYPTAAMLDGRHAHNPWLQELPDPVTKIVWDNYVSISPGTASKLGVDEHDAVRIEAGDRKIELPVHVQPGQHDNVLAVALGYGRKGTDRFTNIGPQWIEARPTVPSGGLVGKNVAEFIKFDRGSLLYDAVSVSLTKIGERYLLASAQHHQSVEVPEYLGGRAPEKRPIIQETTFNSYMKDPAAGSFPKQEADSLWPEDHQYPGHRWGMVIDLSACTGCSACVVACVAENNTPVVGKDEVSRNRGLTWMRIDRYHIEEGKNIRVAHQPMMCQQCGNAPCETVCPVLATVHSEEGLNQQVYNRCVGTRYCSNNCPYKVRRFNWFSYNHGDDMQRLVLNPDVVVRERGVMEKCTFCVQRIQEAKIQAKNDGVSLKDGDIKPACQQSCPAKAIVFGDMNDSKSIVSTLRKDPRYYRVLEEVGIQPSVGYMTLVRNREEGDHSNG